jgi:glycine dehydrogenase subunit 1
MGPQGIREAAQLCFNKASYLAQRLTEAGIPLRYPQQAFFNELLVKLDRPAKEILDEASDAGFLAGYAVGEHYPDLADCLLVAVTEKRTKAEMDALADILSSGRASALGGRGRAVGHDATQFVQHDLSE